MLHYVNQEEISHVPSSYGHYHATNQAVLMAVGSHIGTTAECVLANRVYLTVYW